MNEMTTQADPFVDAFPGVTTVGSTPAVAAPAIDPNTQLAVPVTGTLGSTAPVAEAQPLPAHETFEDAWAKDPTADAPVRTWVDPSVRDNGAVAGDKDFVSAWNDEKPAGPLETASTLIDPALVPPVKLPEPAPETEVEKAERLNPAAGAIADPGL